jgi:DNA-binding response OmpR family regulator
MTSSGSGGDFLARKAEVTHLGKKLDGVDNILIVEDETFDADRLRATLRIILGYGVVLRRAPTLAVALDEVLARKPDLVFLDDLLKPTDTASHSLPFLRRAGYDGPVIVISGQVTRNRKAELLALSAAEVIHKDDVDSVRVTEALIRAYNIS